MAIGVDSPLAQRDVDLIAKLLAYTARIAILLTQIDLLDEAEEREVIDFVRAQLAQRFEQEIPVDPYSTRSGDERLRDELEQKLLCRFSQGAIYTEFRYVQQNLTFSYGRPKCPTSKSACE